jgi:PKD repeat protein
VSFDASASTSPGASITSYAWSFGATGVMASKTYSTAGTYTVTLTITNSVGGTATSSPVTITVNPVGTPTCAPITISFTASDASNKGHPHQMAFAASQVGTPAISNSDWHWTSGVLSDTGKNGKLDFASAGSQSVTLTATPGSCSYTATQIVTAP